MGTKETPLASFLWSCLYIALALALLLLDVFWPYVGAYVFLSLGLAIEALNVWLATHSRKSGCPLISILLAFIAGFLAPDSWGIGGRVAAVVGMAVLHFGAPELIYRRGMAYRQTHPETPEEGGERLRRQAESKNGK